MRTINFLIKPASGLCNMRCTYCFYADEMKNREQPLRGMMSSGTAEVLIEKALSGGATDCMFAFQGGEPTLVGLDFFREFVKLVKQKNCNKVAVAYSIQTNGYCIDEAWAQFFVDEKFLVGLSLDGYADLHNLYRKNAENDSTHNRVMRTTALLKRYGVPFNILTVVTAQTAKHVEKVYSFYQKNGLMYQQYIPCIDPFEDGNLPYSLSSQMYGVFLVKLFDLWYRDLQVGHQPYIRYFENLVTMLIGQPPEACGMLGHCTNQLVLEADGTVYPCDFYVLDQFCIGNICNNTLAEIEDRRERLQFIQDSTVTHEKCLDCKWFPLCRGGCRRDRDYGGQLSLNRYCEAYCYFFEQRYPTLARIAHKISVQQQ